MVAEIEGVEEVRAEELQTRSHRLRNTVLRIQSIQDLVIRTYLHSNRAGNTGSLARELIGVKNL